MKPVLTSFVSGVVFAAGLGIGGMTQPAKVIGFLDFVGNWDPSLALVMIGAIVVYSFFYRLVRSRPSPLFSSMFTLPTRTDIDRRLVVGAAIFGLGWGIAGYCPGPALTSLGSGSSSPVIFTVAMIGGMFFFKWVDGLGCWQADAEKPRGEAKVESESNRVSSIDF